MIAKLAVIGGAVEEVGGGGAEAGSSKCEISIAGIAN